MSPVMVSPNQPIAPPLPVQQPPAKMSRPEVLLLNSHTVSISWMPPVDIAMLQGKLRGKSHPRKDHTRLHLLGFRIRYGFVEKASEAFDFEQTWDANTTKAILKHMEGGRNYWFQVCGFNEKGNGEWSDPSEEFYFPGDENEPESAGEVQQLSRELDLGTQPTRQRPLQRLKKRPAHSSKSATSINISWEKPCDRGSKVVAYDVLFSKDESFTDHGSLRVDGSFTKASLTNLEPNTTYFFRHRAVNDVGCSNWSETSTGVSTMAHPPDPPSPPRLDAAKAFSLTIIWDAPKSHKIPVQKYRLRYSTNPDMDDIVEVPVADTKRKMSVTGLRPLTNYYFQVMAKNQVGSSRWSVYSKPMRTYPAAPAQCDAPAFHEGTISSITLCWPVPDSYGTPISRYDVRMSRHHWMLEPTEYLHVPTTTTEDGMVLAIISNCNAPGVPHYYQIRAGGENVGFGEWSHASDMMFTMPERPNAPLPPKKFRPLPRAITVNWSAAHDNGDPIIEHRLRYDTCADMKAPVYCPVKGQELSHVVTGLLPHTSYFFQISARNSIGWSDWSMASCPVQVVQEPPAKSGAPFLVEGTCTQLTVSFTPPADVGTLDGTTIQAYTVRYSSSYEALEALGRDPDETKKTHKNVTLIHPAKTPLIVKGMQPGSTFFFQVCATNQFGPGDWSDISEPMSTQPSVPNPPTPPIQVEGTDQSIVLQWLAPHNNGCVVRKYNIRVLDEKRKVISTKQLTDSARSSVAFAGNTNFDHAVEHIESDICDVTGGMLQHYNVNGLLPGTYYAFQVAAVNACGRGDWCEPTALLRTEPTVPDPPGVPVAKETGTHHYVATWPMGRDNGSAVTEYTVQYTDNPNFERAVKQITTHEKEVKIEGCTPGWFYYIKVSATNGIGIGPYGESAKIRTAAYRPSEPLPPVVSEIGPTSVHLTWSSPYDGGDKLKGYIISYKLKEEPYDGGELKVEGKRRGLDVGGLSPGRRYIFQIRATNSVGHSDWSQPTRVIQTSPPERPSKTGAPSLLKASHNGMQVAWMPAVDNGAEIIEQILSWSTHADFSANVKSVSVAGLQSRRCSQLETEVDDISHERDDGVSGLIHRMKKMKEQRKTIEDLQPGTAYYFTVKSINKIGESPLSDVSDGLWTAPWKPLQCPMMECIDCSSMWLRFQWVAPHDNGSPVHTYKFRYSRGNRECMPNDGQEGNDQGKRGFKEKELDVNELANEFGNPTEYVLSGLEPGEGYWAAVQAVNGVGTSPWTVLLHESFTNPMEPGGMERPRPKSQTTTSLTFCWTAPSPRGNPIKLFEFYWVYKTFLSPKPWKDIWDGELRPVPVDFKKFNEDGSLPLAYEIHDLLPGTSVRMVMRAKNLIGPGEWSEISDITDARFTTKSCIPETPGKPVLVNDSLRATNCRMSCPCGRPNGESITFFHYRVASNATMTEGLRAWKEEVPQPSTWYEDNTLTYTVTGLDPGSHYWTQAGEENVHGQSVWSEISECIETLPDVPQKPAPPYSDQTTPKSVELRWFAPHDNGAPITGYMLRYKTPEAGAQTCPPFEIFDPDSTEVPQAEIHPSKCHHDCTGLKAGHTYFFQLRCRNEVGWSEWSNASRGFVTRPSKPEAPENMVCIQEMPFTLDMAWDLPEEHGAPVTRYELSVSQKVSLLRWMYFTSRMLSKCIDASRLCGINEDEKNQIGSQTHTVRDLGDINFSDACTFVLAPGKLNFLIEGLAPGKEYYTTIRAKNKAGSGNWAFPIGPMKTKSTTPAHTEALEPVIVHHHMCTLAFNLPYDSGEPIQYCMIKAKWLFGPTSHEEVYWDEEDYKHKLHPHLMEREEKFDPFACEVMELEWMKEEEEKDPEKRGSQRTSGRRKSGSGEEGLFLGQAAEGKKENVKPLGKKVQMRCFPLEGLLAGTEYQVKWCAVNALGAGMYSKSIVISTEPNVPDVPKIVVLEDDTV